MLKYLCTTKNAELLLADRIYVLSSKRRVKNSIKFLCLRHLTLAGTTEVLLDVLGLLSAALSLRGALSLRVGSCDPASIAAIQRVFPPNKSSCGKVAAARNQHQHHELR